MSQLEDVERACVDVDSGAEVRRLSDRKRHLQKTYATADELGQDTEWIKKEAESINTRIEEIAKEAAEKPSE